jgi:hypothetical protein
VDGDARCSAGRRSGSCIAGGGQGKEPGRIVTDRDDKRTVFGVIIAISC